ncbi:YHYH protein [Marinomonas sp.]
MKKIGLIFLYPICAIVLSACGSLDRLPFVSTTGFVLSSTEMNNGGRLPTFYTCDGDSVHPPLSWQGAPSETQFYALIMHHDAPDGVHWYWTLYNIPASNTELKSEEILGEIGTNSVNGLRQYAPPCSKGPGEKSYQFTLYALASKVIVDPKRPVDRDTLLNAIKDITLDKATMVVTYDRKHNKADHPLKARSDDSVKPRNQSFQRQPPSESESIESPRCMAIRESIEDAGFESTVSITCDNEYAYVMSSTYPSHDVMTGIVGTNEQVPVPAQGYAAPIKLYPSRAESYTTIDAAVGVAVNGVPIYDYSSQGELDVQIYDEKHDTFKLGQLDICGGHAGRGDDYHYHIAPTCMIATMENQTSDAIIGWGYDGYPLYADKNPDGSDIEPGALDVCNGQADEKYGYRYQTSSTPPYIIQCLVGNVETQVLPRVAPLSGDIDGIRADLRPPQEGVENLTHEEMPDGSRTMRYWYQGEEFFTTYRPSAQFDRCYDFTQKTISNEGKLETGTFCRDKQAPPQKPKNSSQTEHNSVKESRINTEFSGQHTFRLDAWADNWFAAYLGERLLLEDSVAITTERSFNAESVTFSTDYPIELNVVIKDFKQNDTGLEYIGTNRQQMGDGGFILQLTDTETNDFVAVSDGRWQCKVLHKAPLNKQCENSQNPIAGQGYCTFMSQSAPDNWLLSSFDASLWPNATVHSASAVGPKDGYDDIKWDESAQFIWGEDLETDNTILCKTTIDKAE